jgi:hypothetical protein
VSDATTLSLFDETSKESFEKHFKLWTKMCDSPLVVDKRDLIALIILP